MRTTVSEQAWRVLARGAAPVVFGNPGSTELPFLATMPADMAYVTGLHESSVVAMADGYAQTAQQPVVVNLHSAGGLGNAMGSLVTAYLNRTPLIVIAGQQQRAMLPHAPFLGAPQATLMPQPHVKAAFEPARPEDVPVVLQQALALATASPTGPVFVSVPVDDWDHECAPLADHTPISVPAPAAEALDRLAAALAGADHPALVLGAGVARARAIPAVVDLAQRLDAPVWMAPMSASGGFPEHHGLFAGFLDATADRVHAALAPYDVVAVIGAPAFTYHVPSPSPEGEERSGRTLYVIDDDPAMLARSVPATRILGDPGAAIDGLLARTPTPCREPQPRPARSTPTLPPLAVGELPSTAHVLATVLDQLPPDVLIVEEAPSARPDIHRYLPINNPDQGFMTMASGVLGFGLPAAIGAALADRGRPVVAIVGDGSAMYAIQSLWTAAQHHAPVVVIIIDNKQYGAVLRHANAGNRDLSVSQAHRLGGLDFTALATAQGVSAHRADSLDELREHLRTTIGAAEPVLLWVPVAGVLAQHSTGPAPEIRG